MISNKKKNIYQTVDGQKVFAHKNILAARSLYFRSMFTSQLKEAKEGVVEIRTGIGFGVFNKFLKYLYSEQLDFEDVNEALDLLFVANLFQNDSLKEELSAIIGAHISLDNCSRIYAHATNNECESLKIICKNFMKLNYNVLRKFDKDFVEFEQEIQKELSLNNDNKPKTTQITRKS